MLALGTNVLVALQKRNAQVQGKYESAVARDEVIAIPAFVRYEARRGLLQPVYAPRLRFLDELLALHPSLELDQEAADVAASLHSQLRSQGLLIGDADILIAATALRHGATLVTHNTNHFSRIPGLSLQDWQAEEPEVS